jgi:hypothetical protein
MTTLCASDLSSAERSNVVEFASRKHVEHPPEKVASDRVALEIRSRVDSSVLAQACARAARNVAVWGYSVDDAVRLAKAWALNSIQPEPPRAA